MKSCLLVLTFVVIFSAGAQTRKLNVIAYYSGGPEQVASVQAGKLTHIIFCFGHLQGNNFHLDSKRDSLTIQNLVALKKINPRLKVILSLGGWGGCEKCSPVFSTQKGRADFSKSVLAVNKYFKSDGIDLDWEYPSIKGFPEHPYGAEDMANFTALVKDLRATMGTSYEISFAAGGFQEFLEKSVDWKAVVPVVDRVNLMTYDLVNGYSTKTGHHTALYSSFGQHESTDNAVEYLIKHGLPSDKLVIGAAFYGRSWEDVPNIDHGLYQSGKFKSFINYKDIEATTAPGTGYNSYWDTETKAPWRYNSQSRIFVTYDDKRSMALKTKYAIDHKLDGIMFWELTCDAGTDGLLDAIVATKKENGQ